MHNLHGLIKEYIIYDILNFTVGEQCVYLNLRTLYL